MGSYKSIDMQMKGYTSKIKSMIESRLRNAIHNFVKTFSWKLSRKDVKIWKYNTEEAYFSNFQFKTWKYAVHILYPQTRFKKSTKFDCYILH